MSADRTDQPLAGMAAVLLAERDDSPRLDPGLAAILSSASSAPVDAPDSLILRGEAAARAQRIDLAAPSPASDLTPPNPWAQDVEAAWASARTEGYEDGFAAGRAEGLQSGLAETGAERQLLADTIDQVLSRIEQAAAEQVATVADQVVALALDIAAAVIGRELACSDDPGRDAIARCLDLAPGVDELVAHLHPDDAAQVGELAGLGDRSLTVVADPRLDRGDAIVTAGDTVVDGRIGRAMDRVAEVLR